METVTHISKAALIAALNDMRAFVRVTDCYYKVTPDATRLILVMSDGTEKEFKGMKAA